MRQLKLLACASLMIALVVGARPVDEGQRAEALAALKSLAGTWVSEKPGPDGKPMKLEFKVTAGGSVIHETMFPGHPHEMINTYHVDGDDLIVTHYCAQGIQPRMKLVSYENGVMKFEFKDCTNLKSRDEPHMDGVDIKVDGDKLTETWMYYQDGKTTGHTSFELTRQK
jgi:hypothetical protein